MNNQEKQEGFEERQIPDAPVEKNRRRADPQYGQITEGSVRVRSIFEVRDEICFECDNNGHTFHLGTGEPVPCIFCTAEEGDQVIVPDLDNSLYHIARITDDGLLILRSLSNQTISGFFAASDVVKVVWKLTDETDTYVVAFYASSETEVMEFARTEGLVDRDDDTGACWLSGNLTILICDGNEDF